jgi:hypothetical protein
MYPMNFWENGFQMHKPVCPVEITVIDKNAENNTSGKV